MQDQYAMNVNQYGQPIYINNNQGLQPNPYNQPYPPPPGGVYIDPQPTTTFVIVNDNSRELPCPFCGSPTQTIPVKQAGSVTYLWCCCLFWFTGICCWIPFVVDSCQDTHLICVRCNHAKSIVPANCL